jgi:hypothetical protein
VDVGGHEVTTWNGKPEPTRLPAGLSPEKPSNGPSLWSPSYNYLRTLPTDPSALAKIVYDQADRMAAIKFDGGRDQEAFLVIANATTHYVMPPEVQAAFYRAAMRIPHVTVSEDATDGMGRKGVAVVQTYATEKIELIFDKTTYHVLGVKVTDTTKGQNRTISADSLRVAGIVDHMGDKLPDTPAGK